MGITSSSGAGAVSGPLGRFVIFLILLEREKMTYKSILIATVAFIIGNYVYQLLPGIGKNDLNVALERSFFQGALGLSLSAKMYFGF